MPAHERRPARAKAAVAGLILSIPVLLGVLSAVFGEVGRPLRVGGPFMGPIVLFTIAACTGMALLIERERRGVPATIGWALGPTLLALAGSGGTAVGLGFAAEAIAHSAAEAKGRLIVMGSAVGLITDLAGLALAAILLVGAAVALAIIHRRPGPPGGAAQAMAALAVLGGAALWLLHPVLTGAEEIGGAAPLSIFAVMALGALANAALADGRPGLERVRLLVALLSVAATIAEARAVELQALMELNLTLSETTDRMAQVMLADAYTSGLDGGSAGPLAWGALSLAIALRGLIGLRKLPISAGATAALVGMVAAVAAGRVVSDRRAALFVEAVPVLYLGQASHWFLGVDLGEFGEDTPDRAGLRVDGVPEESDLLRGDALIAVSDRPFSTVRALLEALDDCRCDTEAACPLAGSSEVPSSEVLSSGGASSESASSRACLRPGDPLALTITRPDPDGGLPVNLNTSIPLLLGTDPAEHSLTAVLARPLFDFMWEPNAEASERRSLRAADGQDTRLAEDVADALEERITHKKRWRRLDQVTERWATVLADVRAAGLPDVVAAIPFAESGYRPELQSIRCAKGIWQFIPETASQQGLAVRDCRFSDDPSARYTPNPDAPYTAVQDRVYLTDRTCRIPERRGCATDERGDIRRSTAAALQMLARPWNELNFRDSGALVQLTVATHNQGFGFLARRLPQLNDAEGPMVYTVSADCTGDDCKPVLTPPVRAYVVAVLADHLQAVCFFGKNATEHSVFAGWRGYSEGYCRTLGVPSRGDVSGM